MYQCCIFDLDGTLLSTEQSLTITTNLMLQRFGYEPLSQETVVACVGDGYKVLVEKTLQKAGDQELVHYEEGLLAYMEEFQIHARDGVVPYDGIVELLETMKQMGIKITVLSNKPHNQAVENIEMVFGVGYFDYIAGQKENVPKKPDPAGIWPILDALQVETSDCLYVGDTSVDMQTGLAAKIDTVGVLWGFRGIEELAVYPVKQLVSHPREILLTK